MNVTATLTKNNETVTLVNVVVSGYFIYLIYVDSNADLKMITDFMPSDGNAKTIGTNATVN